MSTYKGHYCKNALHFRTESFKLILAITVVSFITGCATQPSFGPGSSYKIEGKWLWEQDPWHGYFVLNRHGNLYTGTLDDIFEGTYGDLIKDVKISRNYIKFTREGKFGIQYWEGKLEVEDGVLKINDGKWSKERGISGSFYAEKTE